MAEGSEPSFGRQVVMRAWFAAWAFFESKARDAILFVVLLVVGGAAYWRLYGFPATKDQIVPVLIFTIGPIVALWLLLFIWHLWLAPSAMAYEAARAASRAPQKRDAVAPQTGGREMAVNWAIWKQRSSFSLREFAAILAKVDPAGDRETPDRSSFLRLIQEEAMTGKLRTVMDRMARGHEKPDLYPEYFSVQKDVAAKWAAEKSFDFSHMA